ncbi:MAG: hypothetical protein R8P61_28485 [Bacteroidia bacterium]|nr:hypothetical protein [Bacteroidia bacterium]
MNTTTKKLTVGLIALLFLSVFLILNRDSDLEEYMNYDPAFDTYLSAYTAGELSSNSILKVRFLEDMVSSEELGKDINEKLFHFDPKIKGKAFWIDKRTIAFEPSTPLNEAQFYKGKLKVSNLIAQAPEYFKFGFWTGPKRMDIRFKALKASQQGREKWQILEGVISLSEQSDTTMVKFVLQAETAKGDELNINWNHQKDLKTHHFSIEKVKRGDLDQELSISWDGNKVGVDTEGSQNFLIPSKDKFVVHKVHSFFAPDQYLTVEFSDLLDLDQDLKGLIELADVEATTRIEGNRIHVYPSKHLDGDFKLLVRPGIKTISGAPLKKVFTKTLAFGSKEPEVVLLGDPHHSIIPSSGNLIPIRFQARNLKAIDIRIIKIFENNIPQFLQTQELVSIESKYSTYRYDEDLLRVGKLALRKTVALTDYASRDFTKLQPFTLDLSAYVNLDPGAIYEITLGYRREHYVGQCNEVIEENGKHADMLKLPSIWYKHRYTSAEDTVWKDDDSFNDILFSPRTIQRSEPCYELYYTSRKPSRSYLFLASDLGIIAKQGEDEGHYFVTDLNTTEPVKGVEIELYDYTQQFIANGITNAEGKAVVNFPKKPNLIPNKPFLLIAKKDKQRGYLKLDNANALELTEFKIGGNTYHRGLKGYIYGERGLWRPGDTMHISFILEDEEKVLPKGHPVIMQFHDPHTKLLISETQTYQGKNGVYAFHPYTSPNAVPGKYLFRIRVGGTVFDKLLKVETFYPSRLEFKGDPFKEPLRISWLNGGAAAKNLKSRTEVTIKRLVTSFESFPDYSFEDVRFGEYREYFSTVQAENHTNDQGILDAGIPEENFSKSEPEARKWPGILSEIYKVRVFEPGGRYSFRRYTRKVYQHSEYVGVYLSPTGPPKTLVMEDQRAHLNGWMEYMANIVVVDSKGRRVKNREVEVNINSIAPNIWHDQTSTAYKGSSNNFNSAHNSKPYKSLSQKLITDAKGRASWNFIIREKGYFELIVSNPSSNHTSRLLLSSIDNEGRLDLENEELVLNVFSSKTKYQLGEEIELNFEGTENGRALISLESGNNVLHSFWEKTHAGLNTTRIQTDLSMSPNVYAHVTLIQGHKETKNDRPIRLYGIIPIQVEDPNTILEPEISMPNQLRPNQVASIQVSERSGKAMTYTLAIVDKGLLDISEFETPDPYETFYQKEALKVRSFDMYKYLSLNSPVNNVVSIGGGDMGEKPPDADIDRFKPVVIFKGPFFLEAGKNNKRIHKIPIGNSKGTLKTMLIARSGKAYGSDEQISRLSLPLMVLGELPSNMGPNEEISVPVTVFANVDGIKDVEVFLKPTGLFESNGKMNQLVSFSESGTETIFFNLKTKNKTGSAGIKINVRSGSNKDSYETALNVVSPNRVQSKIINPPSISPGESWKATIPWAKESINSNLYLEVNPPILRGWNRRLSQLKNSPETNAEIIVSKSFPLIYLAANPSIDKEVQKSYVNAINSSIAKIQEYQLENGAVSYWKNSYQNYDWLTNYAGHFMLEAEKAGYKVDPFFFQRWISFQKGKAYSWDQNDRLMQAYRLYLLALAKEAPVRSMNQLNFGDSEHPLADWLLAAAYHEIGRPQQAEGIISDFSSARISIMDFWETNMGSEIRDKALMLFSMGIIRNNLPADSLLQILQDKLLSKDELNSHEMAMSMIAILNYNSLESFLNPLEFDYRLNAGPWINISTKSGNFYRLLGNQKIQTLELKNKGSKAISPQINLEESIDSVSSSELNMEVSYYEGQCNSNRNTWKKVQGNFFDQGTDVIVEVKVRSRNQKDIDNLILIQNFPAGFQIISTECNPGSIPTHQLVKDQMVSTFFNLGKEADFQKIFYVQLNSGYIGEFEFPPIELKAKYNSSMYIRGKRRRISITK